MKPRIYTENRGIFGNFVFAASRLFVYAFFILLAVSNNFAQSTSQNFPTPITSNEISGTIKARDIGDSRLTSYFYTFNGNQGDVFLNIVTRNLNGDIDVFNAENLNALTKIVVYADNSPNETGRVIYLRKPEKLILRIQGRTPNDDPATFSIKFAGSFQPAQAVAESEQAKPPEVKTESQSDVIVNSVGTIIGVKPKPTPSPAETTSVIEKNEEEKDEEKKPEAGESVEKAPETTLEEKAETKKEPEKKVEVVITDNIPTEEKSEATKAEKAETEIKPEPKSNAAKSKTRRNKNRPRKNAEKADEKRSAPNPLENVRLIVLFKDGTKIERPMSEVLRVNVDNKGMLTIVSKDGSIGRYSILDVAKMTIE